jgi:dephospho-CoA kinase
MGIRLFGLTGGVASGKSTVAARFRERGLDVIDADAVAREVVELGTEGLAAVVAAFGREVLQSDGTLDRKALGAKVFGDESARLRLNAILHPRIAAATMERAQQLAARGISLACYEAALLVENGLADSFRPLVVVAVSRPQQIERLMRRDGSSREDAVARLDAQLPLERKVAVADYVIDNDGGRESLLAQADDVLAAIRRGESGDGRGREP